MAARATGLLLVGMLLVCGCGIADPLNAPSGPRATTTVRLAGPRSAGTGNEVASPAVDLARLRPADGAAVTPRQALERFGQLAINWTYKTLAAQQRRLARLSIGAASHAQQRAAAQTPLDYQLRRGRIENHGRIVAIAPTGRAGHYVVVTREQITTARASTAVNASYHVTLAVVHRLRSGGYAVSSWQPQN
jgi:hypothetical protein